MFRAILNPFRHLFAGQAKIMATDGQPTAAGLSTALVWLRRDLRLSDNAAIAAASEAADQIALAFVFDQDILDLLPRYDRRVDFIYRSLQELDAELRKSGAGIHVVHGRPIEQIPALAAKIDAKRVFAARDYEPQAIERDQNVKNQLEKIGHSLTLVRDHVVFENHELQTGSGNPYTVFTPYKKKWLATFTPDLVKAAKPLKRAQLSQKTVKKIPTLKSLGFERTNLDELGIQAGESAATDLLRQFKGRISKYADQRDFPGVKGPSYLSVHFRFGTLSIRKAVATAVNADKNQQNKGAQTWLSELIWRDFYFQILANFPHVVSSCFKAPYDKIKWRDDQKLFQAWCTGQTGYPLVDAAMAQINETGYMHNRLRMVVASFLCKDLGISWQAGEHYFALKLNDFDLSANNGGWQWAASSGCDAQPYFRIFNPVTQSQKFDPNGKFIRRYLPELSALTDKQIHAPWLIDDAQLKAQGITLGQDYPRPVVDHALARQETLARYEIVKSKP